MEKLVALKDLKPNQPHGVLIKNVDLVVITDGNEVSVLYGRCGHRGGMMADATINGDDIICGIHGWDYQWKSGISSYNNSEKLHKFNFEIIEGYVCVDELEIEKWEKKNPQPFDRNSYQGQYADTHPIPDEPYVGFIKSLAKNGLAKYGNDGPGVSMGVPRSLLPSWDDIQIVTAQLATRPLLEDEMVETKTIIGPNAKKPLQLSMPIFVSDMSFGALSQEAKVALAIGAQNAGTGICSGEGGMLDEEQQANSKYFYELASGLFGWDINKTKRVQSFHFKFGQGAKTGTGGHLPGKKVTGKIATTRGLPEGVNAISPATFVDLKTIDDYKQVAKQVRDITGGIPIGAKLSAQHIEQDIDSALAIGVDYIILDGRGGGTGAAPALFRDNISVPTIPALARARRHLDSLGRSDITLVITGGLRTHSDYIKALALGADCIAVANSAMQAIGCLGMRACATNNCPVGIATQKPGLRSRLVVEESAKGLTNFLNASVELMQVMARACGHSSLAGFNINDLTTFKYDMHRLSGVSYGGMSDVY